ncbi:hypothetical protein FGO68_gene6359 [Halteria grandinella]|uniref:DUF393 domain-containing protein n=1 Tax=Halteria grandinella TaxID=5974 RepID=A0A8J8SYF0_HALGN|nr:hypothetical protein FGO68_gene6359 [Halteria grandinella]
MFYDGTCKVCLSFVTKLDRVKRQDASLRFVPFQQVENKDDAYISKGIPHEAKYVVFRDDDRDYTSIRSTALMDALYYTFFPYWIMYYILLLIPKGIRDWAYTWFSQNRSKVLKVFSKTINDDIDTKFKVDEKD